MSTTCNCINVPIIYLWQYFISWNINRYKNTFLSNAFVGTAQPLGLIYKCILWILQHGKCGVNIFVCANFTIFYICTTWNVLFFYLWTRTLVLFFIYCYNVSVQVWTMLLSTSCWQLPVCYIRWQLTKHHWKFAG